MNYTIDDNHFSLDKFTLAYIECALWSSTDEDGTSLDHIFDIHDFHHEAIHQMSRDCDAFRTCIGMTDKEIAILINCELGGADFWLTRNHHGSGFWDADYLPNQHWGDEVTKHAHTFGECSLAVNDDGKICLA